MKIQVFRLAAAHRRGVLLEDELAQLEQKNQGEDVQEIQSQIRVEHPIIYHGYNICDLVKTGALSCFTVKDLRVMCDNFELPRKTADKKSTLIGQVIDMVKESAAVHKHVCAKRTVTVVHWWIGAIASCTITKNRLHHQRPPI